MRFLLVALLCALSYAQTVVEMAEGFCGTYHELSSVEVGTVYTDCWASASSNENCADENLVINWGKGSRAGRCLCSTGPECKLGGQYFGADGFTSYKIRYSADTSHLVLLDIGEGYCEASTEISSAIDYAECYDQAYDDERCSSSNLVVSLGKGRRDGRCFCSTSATCELFQQSLGVDGFTSYRGYQVCADGDIVEDCICGEEVRSTGSCSGDGSVYMDPDCADGIISWLLPCTCDGQTRTAGSCADSGATYTSVCANGLITNEAPCVCQYAVRSSGDCSLDGVVWTKDCANGPIDDDCVCDGVVRDTPIGECYEGVYTENGGFAVWDLDCTVQNLTTQNFAMREACASIGDNFLPATYDQVLAANVIPEQLFVIGYCDPAAMTASQCYGNDAWGSNCVDGFTRNCMPIGSSSFSNDDCGRHKSYTYCIKMSPSLSPSMSPSSSSPSLSPSTDSPDECAGLGHPRWSDSKCKSRCDTGAGVTPACEKHCSETCADVEMSAASCEPVSLHPNTWSQRNCWNVCHFGEESDPLVDRCDVKCTGCRHNA